MKESPQPRAELLPLGGTPFCATLDQRTETGKKIVGEAGARTVSAGEMRARKTHPIHRKADSVSFIPKTGINGDGEKETRMNKGVSAKHKDAFARVGRRAKA